MRDCKKNSRKLWYSNLLGNEPVLDENGDETGDTKPVYGIPIPFMASVSPGKGNAYADVFGTNLDYTRSIFTTQKLPITEESLIWCGSMPIINSDNSFDWKTADYTVAGIADGLNQLVVALKARKKNA